MAKTPKRTSTSRTTKPATDAKAKCITVRVLPDLLRAIDAKAAGEYLTREAYIRRAAAAAAGATDKRPTLARGLFSPVQPIGRAKVTATKPAKRPARRGLHRRSKAAARAPRGRESR